MFANASPHLLYECNSENWKINKQNNNSSTRTRPFKVDHAFHVGKKWQDWPHSLVHVISKNEELSKKSDLECLIFHKQKGFLDSKSTDHMKV